MEDTIKDEKLRMQSEVTLFELRDEISEESGEAKSERIAYEVWRKLAAETVCARGDGERGEDHRYGKRGRKLIERCLEKKQGM